MPDPFTDKPWLVIGETGAQSTYAELVSELQSAELEVRRIARPASTSEGLRLLCHALVAEVEMTLVDPLFHSEELAQLGVDATQFEIVRWVPGRSELVRSELMRLAGGASRMRLGLFTSGSTGVPSRVEHSLGTLARNVRIGARHASDIWALTFRPTHIAGVQVWLQALANGNTLVDLTGVPPREALEAMAAHGVTHISASPTYYRSLLGARVSLPGVRSVSLGGELVSSELLSQLRPLFPAARIHNIYASTEAGTLLESAGDLFRIPDDKRTVIEIKNRRLHVHRSLLGDFAAAKPNRDTVADREAVKQSSRDAVTNRDTVKQSSGVPSPAGRHQPTVANREAVTIRDTVMRSDGDTASHSHSHTDSQIHCLTGSSLSDDGWYDTGDLVDEVETGLFRFVARERDWANIGGTKVNPHEVEEAIREHPGVKEARVSAQRNSVTGQLLAAEVVLRKAESGKLKAESGAGEQRAELAAARRDGEAEANRETVRRSDSEAVAESETVRRSDGDAVTNREAVKQSHSLTDLQSYSLTESALRAWLAARLHPAKIPRIIRFVMELPTTYSGKTSRK